MSGRRIELEQATGLRDGERVEVSIAAPELPLDERLRRFRAVCGAWKDDPSIEAVFEAIERDRSRPAREISFDDPA